MKKTSQRSLLFRQNVNRTEADWRRVCPRHGGRPLLKGLLTGHYHFDVQDRFSPTAVEFLVGGNFLFHGEEITIS